MIKLYIDAEKEQENANRIPPKPCADIIIAKENPKA